MRFSGNRRNSSQNYGKTCKAALNQAFYKCGLITLTEPPVLQKQFALQEHIHDRTPEYDGIFCNTDSLACRVRDFLSGQGVTVPRDVQIIGYDGLQDYAAGRYPCSTIVQPISQMAETAVNLLFNRGGIPSPANVCLPVAYAAGGTARDISGGFAGI